MNYDLSDREEAIFRFLKHKRKASLDDIVAHITIGQAVNARAHRTSINMSVKSLGWKLANQNGHRIRLVSGGRGAGRKAVYQLEIKEPSHSGQS